MAIPGSLSEKIVQLYANYISPLSVGQKAAGGFFLTSSIAFLYDPKGVINFASSHLEPLTNRAIDFINDNHENTPLLVSIGVVSALSLIKSIAR